MVYYEYHEYQCYVDAFDVIVMKCTAIWLLPSFLARLNNEFLLVSFPDAVPLHRKLLLPYPHASSD